MAEKEYIEQEIKTEFNNYTESEKYISLNYIHTVLSELSDYCDNSNKYLCGYTIRYLFLKLARKATDAVDVVRCKDCKLRKTEDCAMFCECDCGEQHTWETDNDFCSYGERKDNG